MSRLVTGCANALHLQYSLLHTQARFCSLLSSTTLPDALAG